MKRLLIIGAGGLGRELVDIVREYDPCPYIDVAFIDDTVSAGTLVACVPVIGKRQVLGDIRPGSVDLCVAVGNPAIRRDVLEDVERYGHSVSKIVDPSALIRSSASVQAGTIVLPRAVISSHAFVGAHVVINIGAIIGHDVSIGRYTVIGAGALISGGSTVGEGVLIGAGASILPGTTIENWSTVAMGAAVFTRVLAKTTVVGNPARAILGGRPLSPKGDRQVKEGA